MGGFSGWGWLALLAVPCGVVWLAYRGVREEEQLGTGLTPGFKGWLLLLAIGVCAAPLRLGFVNWDYYSGPAARQAWGLVPDVMLAEAAMNVAVGASAVTLMVLMLRRSRWFRRGFYANLGIAALLPALNALAVYVVMTRRGGDGPTILAGMAPELWRGAITLAVGLAWAAYVARSRRVALTFDR